MEYKIIDKTSYKLHFIKTDKFKTITVRFCFNDLIKKEEITARNMLTDLLIYSTKKYNTRREFVEKVQDLYAPSLYARNYRVGKYISFNLYCSMLNEKYTEPEMIEQTIELLSEIIFNPNIKNGCFDENSYKFIYKNYLTDLKNIKDDKNRYSVVRMLEEIGNGDYSFRDDGYLNDLENIKNEDILKVYKELLNKSQIDIYILGDVDIDYFVSLFDKYMEFNTFKKNKESFIIEHKDFRKKDNVVRESDDSNQSKLVIGCKLKNLTERERNYVITLYNIILGSSPESRFFKNIREKHSICYYISSSLNKVDNLLIIRSGIDKDNFDKCVKLIKQEMDDIKNGGITDEDIANAKNIYLTRLDEILDNSEAIINTYLAMDTLNLGNIDERKKEILTVSKDEIEAVSKKIYMDTIYLLEGELENEEN